MSAEHDREMPQPTKCPDCDGLGWIEVADLEQTVMNLIDRVEALEDTTPLQAAIGDTTRFVQVRDDLWVNLAQVTYVMADGSGTYVSFATDGVSTPWAIGDVLRALGVEG